MRSPASKGEGKGHGYPVRKAQSRGRPRPGDSPGGLSACLALPLKAASGQPVCTQESKGQRPQQACSQALEYHLGISLPPGLVHPSMLPGPSQSIPEQLVTEPGPRDGGGKSHSCTHRHSHGRVCIHTHMHVNRCIGTCAHIHTYAYTDAETHTHLLWTLESTTLIPPGST